MTGTIRINDLGHPQLDERQRAALAAADAHPVTLTSQAVMEAAVANTGLSDFGAPEFRLRMDLWLADAEADRNLTEFGRAAVHRVCVRFASTRLKALRLLRQHPEIEHERIEAPIVVLGLPRSGTTHLVNLLATDPRRRSLPYWEACEPVPDQGGGPANHSDPRWKRAAAGWAAMSELLPLMQLMHPLDPDHVHEDLELQGPDFSSYYPEWIFRAESWREHYLSHDQRPHYEYLRTMLKMLQWVRGPKQWVLKCPQHLEQLGPLLEVFPDARIVITQRDPVASIQSAVTMSAYTGRLRYRKIEVDELFEYWSQRMQALLRALVRDFDQIPEQQRHQIDFGDLITDDMSAIARVYDTFGLTLPAHVMDRQRRFSSHQSHDSLGRVGYDLTDFGVDGRALREQFAFYFEAFPNIQPEVR